MSFLKKSGGGQQVDTLIAPAWFIEAVRKGASEKELKSMTRDFCRKALSKAYEGSWQASSGAPEITEPDDNFVELMYTLYRGNNS